MGFFHWVILFWIPAIGIYLTEKFIRRRQFIHAFTVKERRAMRIARTRAKRLYKQ